MRSPVFYAASLLVVLASVGCGMVPPPIGMILPAPQDETTLSALRSGIQTTVFAGTMEAGLNGHHANAQSAQAPIISISSDGTFLGQPPLAITEAADGSIRIRNLGAPGHVELGRFGVDRSPPQVPQAGVVIPMLTSRDTRSCALLRGVHPSGEATPASLVTQSPGRP